MSLDDIPLDAEYEGKGPLFVWVPARRRWVDWKLAKENGWIAG